MGFLDDIRLTNQRFEMFVKDLDQEVSKIRVEEWKKEKYKTTRKNKVKYELPIDIKHSR